jgi:hypothetical protein
MHSLLKTGVPIIKGHFLLVVACVTRELNRHVGVDWPRLYLLDILELFVIVV